MSFRLEPKSVTLNDLERRNVPYFALFHRSRYDVVVKSSRSLSHLLMSFLFLYCRPINCLHCCSTIYGEIKASNGGIDC